MSSDDTTATRTEHDSMGDIEVPRDALWRAQTQRAVENFPISGTPLEPALIHAIGEVKAAATEREARLRAAERRERQLREAETARAVIAASDRVLARLEVSIAEASALRAEIEQSRSGREETLRTVFGAVEAQPHDVLLQDRDERYWLYVARVPSQA